MVELRDLQNSVLYFNKFDMFTATQTAREDAAKDVQSANPDILLNTPIDDFVVQVVDRHRLDVPVLLRDQAHLEEPRETTLTINEFGRVYHPVGTVLTPESAVHRRWRHVLGSADYI